MSHIPDEVQRYLARLDEAFDGVVTWVFARGTLPQFPRVIHFVGKENGGSGWEDSYQNILIERLTKSKWFRKDGDHLFSCPSDGTTWFLDSEEWRMCAYKMRLTPAPENKPSASLILGAALNLNGHMFSEDFFRTVGAEPKDAVRVSLADVVQYLTTLKDGTYLDLTLPKPEKSKVAKRRWWGF